jgi:hypothetical protein
MIIEGDSTQTSLSSCCFSLDHWEVSTLAIPAKVTVRSKEINPLYLILPLFKTFQYANMPSYS